MATKKTELATYYKRLADLDNQRRAVIREIKSHPAHALSYIKEAIDAIAKQGIWYIANTPKGEKMTVERKDKVFRVIGGSVERQQSNVKRINDTLYLVKLETELLTGIKKKINYTVSVDRSINPQILQSCSPLSDKDLIKIKKEIAEFEKSREKRNKITELEAQMKLIQAEIEKLKK
jgi:hypothetical protein